MQTYQGIIARFLLLTLLCISSRVYSETQDTPPSDNAIPDTAQLETLIKTLEDPTQRQRLIDSLHALIKINEQQAAEAEEETVKTAASELVELAANKVSELTRTTALLLKSVEHFPDTVKAWLERLQDPTARKRWLVMLGRLVAVLGAGFVLAAILTRLTYRLRQHHPQALHLPVLSRILHLFGHLAVDLIPILAFTLAAYGILAIADASQQTRLVAVALINASILSRLIRVVSAFFFAPQAPHLRLWKLSDETANYIHQWVKRLSVISVYGFFGLQASLLLGLHADGYRISLKLLGLIILVLLLVLIAQNRTTIAQVLAAHPDSQTRGTSQLYSLRKGLARIWHLIAGIYLVAIYIIWMLQVENGAEFVLQATLLSLLVIGVSRLLMSGTDQLFDHGLRLSSELRSQFPGLEKRLNRYFPVLSKILKAAIALIAILVLASAWGINALTWFSEGAGKVLLIAILNILLIIMIALFLWELASGSVEHYLAQTDDQGKIQVRSPRIRTLLTVARNALLVVLSVVATLMVLSELGINIAPLLAGAGVVGLAIGFGAQRLVQDVINGVFILFQDLMSVGDVVKLGDKAGVVEALSIRTVRLRDLAGTVHTIPFSTIEGVSNLTRDYSFHVFEVGIAYRENVDQVIDLLKQIGEELQADHEVGSLILEPLEVFGLDAFGDSAIVIKGRIKTQPIKQWQVGRAFNRLVKQHFDEQGIEIPFPHRTLYFGMDKQGFAPPAFVQMERMRRDIID